jgi:Spy/CpxP family protein refolding chaperone
MKRILITLTVAIALLATAAIAQHPRMMGERACDPLSFLGLTADQKAQWDSLHQQLRTSIEPLLDQKRAAEEQLRSLADAAAPDANAIGKQVLAIKAIDQQIKAAHEATAAKVAAMLTPEQKAKFDAMRALHECAGGPRGMAGGPGPRH